MLDLHETGHANPHVKNNNNDDDNNENKICATEYGRRCLTFYG